MYIRISTYTLSIRVVIAICRTLRVKRLKVMSFSAVQSFSDFLRVLSQVLEFDDDINGLYIYI